jgi:plasmid maintenance system antidote protein VapI
MQNKAAREIRRWLTWRGTTARVLARAISINETYLSHLIAGRRIPSLEVAYRLLDTCGIRLEWWRQ